MPKNQLSRLFLHDSTVLGHGSTGIVWKVSDTIVVKTYYDSDHEDVEKEVAFYKFIDEHKLYNPHIIQCFFSTPRLLFLENAIGGSLNERLRRNKSRVDRPVTVAKIEEPSLALQWMAELSGGIAWLEALGYVHADIRPVNLLLDAADHLKIGDLGCVALTGGLSDGGPPPYARVLGPEAGSKQGSSGTDGPRTEQFAIGSVFYYISRGFEPFDDEDWGKDHGPKVVRRLQLMDFPPLDQDNSIDVKIGNCWHNHYQSVRALSLRMTELASCTRSDVLDHPSSSWLMKQRKVCEALTQSQDMLGLIQRIDKGTKNLRECNP